MRSHCTLKIVVHLQDDETDKDDELYAKLLCCVTCFPPCLNICRMKEVGCILSQLLCPNSHITLLY